MLLVCLRCNAKNGTDGRDDLAFGYARVFERDLTVFLTASGLYDGKAALRRLDPARIKVVDLSTLLEANADDLHGGILIGLFRFLCGRNCLCAYRIFGSRCGGIGFGLIVFC